MPHSTVQRQCPTCQQPFTALLKRVNAGRGIYCTRSCVMGARIGELNPSYKHGDSRHASRYTKPYKAAHPEISAAHQIVHRAVRSGALKKPDDCEDCGQAKRLDAHHEDYSQPLAVRWLCRRCHNAVHMAKRAA